MKKIVALALCVVMVLGLLSGCQKPMDIKTLTQKMDEAVKGQTAMAAKMDMEMEMTMGMPGMTLDMGVDMAMDMKADLAEGNLYVDMDANMEMLGETQDMSMEIYGVTEGDSMTMYMYEAASDTWIKFQEESVAAQAEELQGMTITMSEIPEEKMTLAEEKELVNDRECYVLTVDIDGTYFDDAVKAAMEVGMEGQDKETKALLENIDWSTLSAKMVYHVDAETFIAIQMTGEILGMGDVLNSMLGEAMGELMGMLGTEDAEFTVDIPVCRITMTDISYTEVEVPAVPQEAIDNAIDADAVMEEPVIDESLLNNPAQADGSYLLSSEGDSVHIVIPEGYIPAMSEPESLGIMTPDYMNSVSYALVSGITDEYMRAYVGEILTYAQEGEYYLSHTEPAELNGFIVSTQLSNDGTGTVVAWKQMDATMLIVEVYFVGESFDAEALLSGVEIIAE